VQGWLKRIRSSLRNRLSFTVGWVLGWILRGLFVTQRLRVVSADERATPYLRDPSERYLFCGWHEQLLFGGFAARSHSLSAMVSQHRDGGLVAGAFRAMGMTIVRGSSSRGGAAALRQAIEVTRACHMAITPDGPRGPRRVLKEGVVYLASRTGLAVVPVACASDRSFLIRGSWTDLIVPFPFGRTWMVYGDPILVPPGIRRDELARYTQLVQQAVEDLNDRAVELSGVPMPSLESISDDQVNDTPDDRLTRAA